MADYLNWINHVCIGKEGQRNRISCLDRHNGRAIGLLPLPLVSWGDLPRIVGGIIDIAALHCTLMTEMISLAELKGFA
jgi:hypothetical protein